MYHNTHGIINQLIGLCMYLNLDYISSKKHPTVDVAYINSSCQNGNGITYWQKGFDSHEEKAVPKHEARIPKYGKVHHGIKRAPPPQIRGSGALLLSLLFINDRLVIR